MKLQLICTLALALLMDVTSATNVAARVNVLAQDSQSIYASVERVTVVELQKLMAEGKAVVVDVRLPEQYAAGHIKGAWSIPLMNMEARAAELPRDRQIITYCS